MKNKFVQQTAFDYDLDIGTVQWIYDNWHDDFYDKLEEVISERAKQGQGSRTKPKEHEGSVNESS